MLLNFVTVKHLYWTSNCSSCTDWGNTNNCGFGKDLQTIFVIEDVCC